MCGPVQIIGTRSVVTLLDYTTVKEKVGLSIWRVKSLFLMKKGTTILKTL